MRKPFMTTILTVLFVLLFGIGAFAVKQDAFTQDEYDLIMNVIQGHKDALSFIGMKDIEDSIKKINRDEIKRVYSTNVDIPKTWEKEKTVYAFMGDSVKIKVPIVEGESIYVITLSDTKGFVQFLGVSQGANVQENVIDQSFSMTTSAVYEDLKEKGLDETEIKDIQYFMAPQYANTFMIFTKTSKEEYLVPFCAYDQDLGFESGKLYTASELVSIFSEYDAYNEGDLGGGVMMSEKAEQTSNHSVLGRIQKILTVGGVVLVIVFMILVVFFAERKKHTN